jgi:hypothetical protein
MSGSMQTSDSVEDRWLAAKQLNDVKRGICSDHDELSQDLDTGSTANDDSGMYTSSDDDTAKSSGSHSEVQRCYPRIVLDTEAISQIARKTTGGSVASESELGVSALDSSEGSESARSSQYVLVLAIATIAVGSERLIL